MFALSVACLLWFQLTVPALFISCFESDVAMCVCLCVCKAEVSRQKADPLSQRNGSFAASREVWKYITDSGITTVGSETCILNCLIWLQKWLMRCRCYVNNERYNIVWCLLLSLIAFSAIIQLWAPDRRFYTSKCRGQTATKVLLLL